MKANLYFSPVMREWSINKRLDLHNLECNARMVFIVPRGACIVPGPGMFPRQPQLRLNTPN